ncbi:putative ethyl tert-butyl ether degradation protein [Lasiodiplodia theobromae]|uniref:EthD domain-containing protein n=1 Tax=Lasiodiplodia theobromae TaxID=45133 RepID=A0A5N5DRI1_9PEZI|nr:Ethyl tert-butyl ether degradation protein [Lasiodiplodia theobromae]KAB2580515.1 hypothetical protein DBV05_g732 [Lasiodiplodia theobromae]KAF4541104.1 Ethyl tert-butyl ether degradation protein [Lasiodiplodia theobromae]KAF9632361.1 putative ethyl tert-butyl ether degradation protein [Lasiodiplodia theobromae]
MAVTVTVLYPNVSDATFDLEYYLKTHMPLAHKNFGPHGMKGYKVARVVGTASGDPAPYSIQCTLEFDTVEQVKTAVSTSAGPVMADVPNFSNQQPIFLIGEIVGTN